MGIILLIIFAFVMLLAGIITVFIPILPGAPLAWLGIFAYAYGTNFEKISGPAVALLGALALLTLVMDWFMPMLGVKGQGASRYAVWGALAGGLVGLFMLGPVGIIAGPFLGAFLGEYAFTMDPRKSFKSGMGTLVGFVVGSLLKVAIIFTMAFYFLYILIF
jgi:uncharacterized protein